MCKTELRRYGPGAEVSAVKDGKRFEFQGVAYTLEPRIVRIPSDEKLTAFLKEKKKAARSLSDSILAAYRAAYGEELKSSRDSLAVEICMHCIVQKISRKLEKRFRKNRLIRLALERTEVIDCGEKCEDNNRFVWDFIAWFISGPRRRSSRHG